jgi:hypothetical protein
MVNKTSTKKWNKKKINQMKTLIIITFILVLIAIYFDNKTEDIYFPLFYEKRPKFVNNFPFENSFYKNVSLKIPGNDFFGFENNSNVTEKIKIFLFNKISHSKPFFIKICFTL